MSARRTNRKRRGTTITEATIAIGLSAVVLGGVAQLVAVTSNQQRVSERRSAAVREAGNLMEDLMSRSWTDVTPENMAAIEPSEWCRQTLPDARLRVDVNSEGEQDETKRISIQIDWQNVAGRRGEPVRLVAWRFRYEESE